MAAGRPSAPVTPETPGFDIQLTPREEAISLLRIGAEVEHALMVEYLYAAYSLNEEQKDPAHRALVQKWKSIILEIAREEMGHLATVENLLTLIGGPLSFDRDDYPIHDPELWPFPFQLQPLTKYSLGTYVLAEMPSEKVLEDLKLKEETDAIKKKVKAEGDLKVHRVGLIYEAIKELFQTGPMIEGPAAPPFTDPHPFISTVDIQSNSQHYQVTASAWGLGYKKILIETAHDRTSATTAIDFISIQGEGNKVPTDLSVSHFGRFLGIYREFPDEGEWMPACNVAVNPTTNPKITDPSRRIEGDACLWAELSNVRYRMLLMYLQHSFAAEVAADSPSQSPRGSLISWSFGEMYNIRSLSEILMSMPLRSGATTIAGPPFEMPDSLALPTRSADRWRVHRDLLISAIALVNRLLKTFPAREQYLRALLAADQAALQQTATLIGV
jgi:rubrerythrin